MWKKAIWSILILGLVISWPLSLIKKPAYFDKKTIFYPISENERWNFEKKLALDTSFFKKFYYNKATIFKDRYLKNLGVMIDLNNYFFIMHPREDVAGVDYRFKYPFITIIFLVLAIKKTIQDRKMRKFWWILCGGILILSFLKQVDGWDIVLYLPITYLLIIGAKELNKNKYSWLIELGLIGLMIIETGRIFL